eukprot:jgi/Hompol1/2007/HPOL_005814-RA
MLRCSGCRLIRYCSNQCQRNDWMLHKLECQGFQRIKPRVPCTEVRLACRLLYRRSKDVYEFDRILGSMVAHQESFSQTTIETLASFVLMVRSIIGEESMLPSGSEMLQLMCKIAVNAMSIERGVGIFAKLSAVNHSCDPNACVVFGLGGLGRLVAMKSIAVDQEVTISYIDQFQAKKMRQRQLREQYFFECVCSLCSMQQETRDLMLCVHRVKPTPELVAAAAASAAIAASAGLVSSTGGRIKPRIPVSPVSTVGGINVSRCSGTWSESTKMLPCPVCNLSDTADRNAAMERLDELAEKCHRVMQAQHSDPAYACGEGLSALVALSDIAAPSHSLLIKLRTVLTEILIGMCKYEAVTKIGVEQLFALDELLGVESGGAWPMQSSTLADIFKASLWASEDTLDLSQVDEYGRQALSK